MYDEALVCGEARVHGRAEVYGRARVFGETAVYEEATVRGEALAYGEALVYGEAVVCGKARVFGEAKVRNLAYIGLNARVSSQKKNVKVIGPIGSKGRYTTFARSKDNDILVFCGCFSGTIDEFESRVREVHKGTDYEKEYLGTIEYVRKMFSMQQGER